MEDYAHCKCCDDLLDDDEVLVMSSITVESHNAKVQNGDVICETCKTESLCGRCGEYTETSCSGFWCEKCDRGILIECTAVCWCQCHEAICKDCILKEPENRWKCEKCNVDLRESLSGELTLCEDAQESLCVECM